MPLDPNIPLSTRVPQMRSPLQTMGAIAQLRAAQDDNEQRRLMNEQRRRTLEDDDAIRSTLQRHRRPDDAVEDLYQQGRSSAAAGLGKQLFEHRTAQAKALDEQLKTTATKLKLSTQVAQGVVAQGTDNAARTGKKAIEALLGPEMAAELGDTYDPERWKMAVAWGTERTEFLKSQQEAIVNAREAWKLGLQPAPDGTWSEDKLKRDEHWRKATANLLSTARKPEEWDSYRRLLDAQGAPVEILAEFGNWDAEAPARAVKLGMTSKEEADVAHQGKMEGFRGEEIAIRRTEAAKDPQAQMNRRAEAQAERWRQAQLTALEKARAEGTEEIAPAELSRRKLSIEDSYRSQIGQPPLLESEWEMSSKLLGGEGKDTAATKRDLAALRRTFKDLTGGVTILERMEQLTAELKKEKDPRKQATIRQGLARLYEQYKVETGRGR